MILGVIERSGLPQALLSRDSGLSRHTLHSWAAARTTPSRESREQLAAGLRRRAGVLQELAAEMEGAEGKE